MRSLSGMAIATLALITAAPALAADFRGLRPAYPTSWETGEDNPLRFEAGVRYWMSWGGQDATFPSVFGNTVLSERDQTHIGEGYFRIDDLSTQSYLKAYGGLNIAASGNYQLQQPGIPSIDAGLGGAGRVGYIVSDFGWLPFGEMRDGFALGGLVGYQYWNDSPDIGRGNFAVINGPSDISWTPGSATYSYGGDSKPDNLDIHALRLGVTAQVDINDQFDIRAEAAAIPYSWVSGTLGPHEIPTVRLGNTTFVKASETSVTGHGYGAAGELMVGFHPTENLTLRVGGRAWYVGGTLDATYKEAAITDPSASTPAGPIDTPPGLSLQNYIVQSQFAQVFRYGALVELTGRF